MAVTTEGVQKHFWMSLEEAELLSQAAADKGMSEAKYLRFLISQKPNDYPEIRLLLRELINEINHIGVNVNQIVHHHNYELYSEKDRRMLTAYLKKVDATLREVVRKFGDL